MSYPIKGLNPVFFYMPEKEISLSKNGQDVINHRYFIYYHENPINIVFL